MLLYPTVDLDSGSELSEEELALLCATYDETGIEGLADALPGELSTGSAEEDRDVARELREECEVFE